MKGFFERQMEKNLQKLYGAWEAKKQAQIYKKERKRLLLQILMVTAALVLLLELKETLDSDFSAPGELKRKEAAYEKALWMVPEQGEKREVRITVEQRQHTKEEAEALLAQAAESLPDIFLKENSSADAVRSSLYFPGRLPDTDITVYWQLDRYDVLSSTGEIRAEQTSAEGTPVRITAVLKLQEELLESVWYVRVFPPVLSEEEQETAQLKAALEQADAASRHREERQLPKEIQGVPVSWKEQKEHTGIYIGLLGILCSVLVYAAKAQELMEQVKKKERQLLMDYPGILQKLQLFLGAGMTVQRSFFKLVQDYEAQRAAGADSRYAYEEMLLTCRELKSGVSEREAYERFGKRCGLPCYTKLSALLNQYLQKGTRGFTEVLELEAIEAMEERRRLAKKMGEEQGTRLLLPMFLLLVVVVIIVMAPAIMAIQI